MVHGDVKPYRMLLNGDFCGCLVDSRLARLIAEDHKLDHSLERSKSGNKVQPPLPKRNHKQSNGHHDGGMLQVEA